MTTQLRGKIGAAILGVSLLLGVGAASAVQAQYPQYPYPQDRDGRYDRRDQDDRYRREHDEWHRRHGRDDDRYGRRDDDYYRNDRYGRGNYGYRMAERKGFEDGQWEGSNRAREGKSYDPYGTRSYKKATDGYDRSFGDKGAYQQAYRRAYLEGYDEGYGRYGRRY